MNGAHWSYNADVVKVFGINAYVTIPLIAIAVRPSSIMVVLLFLATLVFFIVVENILKLRVCYVIPAIRYTLLGTVRTPKVSDFDM